MNFMNLTRMIGFLVIGWTMLAIGMGALGVGAPAPHATTFFTARPSQHDVVSVGTPDRPGDYESRLVDRVTGESKPIGATGNENWELISVLPWRDQNGNLEGVGRWKNVRPDPSERPFCGLGLLTLPEGTVVRRVTLDVLPTGKPCLVPGRSGEVLFPTGDGQLYRCHLSANPPDRDLATIESEEEDELTSGQLARPVRWRCAEPGSGKLFIYDPVWPTDRRVRDYVFVALNTQKRNGGKFLYNPAKLWWLRMSTNGDEILAAGPLTAANTSCADGDMVSERFPTIAVGRAGKLSVVYMTRGGNQKSWRLRSAGLDFDSQTTEPILLPTAPASDMAAADLAPEPLVVSTDGQHVFAVAASGRIATLALASTRVSPAH